MLKAGHGTWDPLTSGVRCLVGTWFLAHSLYSDFPERMVMSIFGKLYLKQPMRHGAHPLSQRYISSHRSDGQRASHPRAHESWRRGNGPEQNSGAAPLPRGNSLPPLPLPPPIFQASQKTTRPGKKFRIPRSVPPPEKISFPRLDSIGFLLVKEEIFAYHIEKKKKRRIPLNLMVVATAAVILP